MIFFDASAIVKAFVTERGSPLVHAAIVHSQGELYLTPAVALEVLSTLAKQRRAGDLTRSEYLSARTRFIEALGKSLQVVEVRITEFEMGYELADGHQHVAVGAMDILHIASALRLQAVNRQRSLVIASADRALLSLARAVGLRVIDPETANLQTLLHLTRSAHN